MKHAGRATHWLSDSSLRLGVAASLLLHLLFGGWMVLKPASTPPPPVRLGELWFEDVAAPEEKHEEAVPVPKQQQPALSPKKKRTQKERTDAPTASVDRSSDVPREDDRRHDTPRAAPSLVPSELPLSLRGNLPVEPSRGETIHPDDPRFDPDVIAAKEKKRVKRRVDGFAEDTLAEARAQSGLPHPYLVSLRDEGRKGLDRLAKERGVRASGALAGKVLAQRMQSATQSYGRGGNPDLGPPGQAPRLSEKITQPDQQALKALAQATELFADLTHGKPLLTLTLELRQSKTNETKTTIVKASIDPSFDAFVLEAWPLSIKKAGPPPDDAFRSSELRSIWEIEGWPGRTDLDKAMTHLPTAGVMGIPLTRLVPGATQGLGYEFRARLLRVY